MTALDLKQNDPPEEISGIVSDVIIRQSIAAEISATEDQFGGFDFPIDIAGFSAVKSMPSHCWRSTTTAILGGFTPHS